LLALWFGAALFFSVVVAPAAFGVLRAHGLPNASELAGAIVTRSLSVVNVAGFLIALLLLVTIFFAISRRNPISGLLTGGAIGVFQDALTGLPIGLNGIAKTLVGYAASSLGVKIDVENAGARLLVTLVFCVAHKVIYFTVARGMVNLTMHWNWPHELWSAFVNAIVGVFMFYALDRFKLRT